MWTMYRSAANGSCAVTSHFPVKRQHGVRAVQRSRLRQHQQQGKLQVVTHLGVSLVFGGNDGQSFDFRINNNLSSWLAVSPGVPQGSVLYPLLFIAYTADLPIAVESNTTWCSTYSII